MLHIYHLAWEQRICIVWVGWLLATEVFRRSRANSLVFLLKTFEKMNEGLFMAVCPMIIGVFVTNNSINLDTSQAI